MPIACPTCGRAFQKGRSNNQNSYYWGICVSMIADETGDDPEKIHQELKEQFLPRMFVTIGDQEREENKTTTLLTTSQMEDYLSRIRAFVATHLNLSIPAPNESPLSPPQL